MGQTFSAKGRFTLLHFVQDEIILQMFILKRMKEVHTNVISTSKRGEISLVEKDLSYRRDDKRMESVIVSEARNHLYIS